MIGLLIVAAVIGVVVGVRWEVVVSVGFGAVAWGGRVAWLNPWLIIPIFGSDFWDPHWKQNSDSVFDSGDSGWIFFEIAMSGKSKDWNSDFQNLEFQ